MTYITGGTQIFTRPAHTYFILNSLNTRPYSFNFSSLTNITYANVFIIKGFRPCQYLFLIQNRQKSGRMYIHICSDNLNKTFLTDIRLNNNYYVDICTNT